jgi:predicted anti-sigma-YlaC factor YlaD
VGERELSCRELVSRLGDYADDDVAAALRKLIESHLRDCPDCRCFFAQYRLTILLCARLRA